MSDPMVGGLAWLGCMGGWVLILGLLTRKRKVR